jgi:hypothetical protein
MTTTNPIAQAAAVFKRLLAKGRPVAFEEAAKCVVTPEGFDRRAFGHIPAGMARRGEIAEAGFRRSNSAKHNAGIKRLWVLVDPKGGAK